MPTRQKVVVFILLVLLAKFTHNVNAGETGHFTNGLGLRAASIPPPGLYLNWYNYMYTSDKLIDIHGDSLDADAEVFAEIFKPVWITDRKIFGGDLGALLAVPFSSVDLEVDALNLKDDRTGLGDIYTEAFIGWHTDRFDYYSGLGLYAPTGRYDKTEPASPGKGFWSLMYNAGFTYYVDKKKSWPISVVGRYEMHCEKRDTDVEVGDNFHIEWSIGKKLTNLWEVAIDGYSQWQITDDSGSDVTWDTDVHDKRSAIGPEIMRFIPQLNTFARFRYQKDFSVVDSFEGDTIYLEFDIVF